MLFYNLGIFLVACFMLILSGNVTVTALSKISQRFRMSEFFAGFIVMAIATSLPDLFVAVSAAVNRQPEIVIGSIIGSNILDLTLIVGVAALLGKALHVKSKTIKHDSMWMIAITGAPIVLMWDKILSRWDGIILISLFVLYLWKIMGQKREFHKGLNVPRHKHLFQIFLLISGILLLFVSSQFVVKYAGLLAVDFALPTIIVGLFLVAMGTSLPELTFETHAVMQKHEEMALGDVIGSVVINSTLVLGVAAIIFPIQTNFMLFLISAFFMFTVAVLFTVFLESGDKLTWSEGLALIFLYIFFLLVEFTIKGVIAG